MRLTPPTLLRQREAKKDQQTFVIMRCYSQQSSPFGDLFWQDIPREEIEQFHARGMQKEYKAWKEVEQKNPDGTQDKAKWLCVVVRDEDLAIPPWNGPEWNDESGEETQSLEILNPDEHGRMIGFAKWEWRPANWAEESECDTQKNEKQKEDDERQLPDGVPKDMLREIESKIKAQQKRYFNDNGHYYLSQLSTSPSHGRQGVGGSLASWVFHKADAEQVNCCLHASQQGYGLYKKLGFQELGHVEIDLAKYGGEGIHKHVTMIRYPKPISATDGSAAAT